MGLSRPAPAEFPQVSPPSGLCRFLPEQRALHPLPCPALCLTAPEHRPHSSAVLRDAKDTVATQTPWPCPCGASRPCRHQTVTNAEADRGRVGQGCPGACSCAEQVPLHPSRTGAGPEQPFSTCVGTDGLCVGSALHPPQVLSDASHEICQHILSSPAPKSPQTHPAPAPSTRLSAAHPRLPPGLLRSPSLSSCFCPIMGCRALSQSVQGGKAGRRRRGYPQGGPSP